MVSGGGGRPYFWHDGCCKQILRASLGGGHAFASGAAQLRHVCISYRCLCHNLLCCHNRCVAGGGNRGDFLLPPSHQAAPHGPAALMAVPLPIVTAYQQPSGPTNETRAAVAPKLNAPHHPSLSCLVDLLWASCPALDENASAAPARPCVGAGRHRSLHGIWCACKPAAVPPRVSPNCLVPGMSAPFCRPNALTHPPRTYPPTPSPRRSPKPWQGCRAIAPSPCRRPPCSRLLSVLLYLSLHHAGATCV